MPHLLPPSRSSLETALSIGLGPRLLDGPMHLRGFKVAPADALIPWLIWEYGLEELLPYLPDPRRAIREGVAWQRIRGTEASLRAALSWRGLDDVAIEEGTRTDFAVFQIDPGRVPETAEVIDIIGLSRLAAPARSKLVRLYHDYDLRALVGDHGVVEGGQWDDWSGVGLDGVVQSYAWRVAGRVRHPRSVARIGGGELIGARHYYDRAPRVDLIRWDAPLWPDPVPPALVEIFTDHGIQPAHRVIPPEAWELPEAALADGVVLDQAGTVYDGLWVHIRTAGRPAATAEDLTWEEAERWEWQPVNRLTVEPIGAVMAVPPVPAPLLAVTDLLAFTAADQGLSADRAAWEQPVDDRGSRPLDTEIAAGRLVADASWGTGRWPDQPWGVVSPTALVATEVLPFKGIRFLPGTSGSGDTETLAGVFARPAPAGLGSITELLGARQAALAPWGPGGWPDQPWGAITAGFTLEELTT
jgi:hypothetical protein